MLMRFAIYAALLAGIISGCSSNQTRTRQMYPDCTQAAAGEPCMYRNT